MNNLKQHIVFKTITLVLVASLLLPAIAKFSHMFAHHKHDICLGEKSTHLHEINTDCNLHKFNLNTPYCFFSNDIEILVNTYVKQTSTSLYTFLNNHKQLSFSLRGPPVLV